MESTTLNASINVIDVCNETNQSLNDVEEIPSRYPFSHMIIIMVMLTIFSVIGVTGNALVLYVFSQKRDRLVANHFIVVLAIVDFITCLVVIPATMYLEYKNMELKYDFLCKLYHFLNASNIPFSVFIMVAIAVDRYFCICHPFLQVLTAVRARIVSVVMAIFASILGIITACIFGVYVYGPEDTMVWDYNMATTTWNESMDTSTLDYVFETNVTYKAGVESDTPYWKVLYVGVCMPNFNIFDLSVQLTYHKIHTALYAICLFIIVVLYALIYRLVRMRRARRLQQQAVRLLPLGHTSTSSAGSPVTDCITLNGDSCRGGHGNTKNDPGRASKHLETNKQKQADNETKLLPKGKTGELKQESGNAPDMEQQQQKASDAETGRVCSSETRRDSRRERMRIANLKTAAMLFVVTVVFVITYMPAFLMAVVIKKHNVVLHYLFFANNVANPIIYSFMNTNFREDLARIIKRNR